VGGKNGFITGKYLMKMRKKDKQVGAATSGHIKKGG
jgi:hypothetical protein